MKSFSFADNMSGRWIKCISEGTEMKMKDNRTIENLDRFYIFKENNVYNVWIA